LEAKEKQMQDALKRLKTAPPGSGNISANDGHLALQWMNQKEERYTQWVRASYPYVDSFRAPITTLFKKYPSALTPRQTTPNGPIATRS
jgi:hypothetical protein